MNDFLRIAFVYLNGLWRYRWYALIVAAVACPVGWFYAATLPDEYAASARVYLDSDSVLTPLLKGLAIQTDDSRRVAMMTKVLFSRENVEKLARMTDMDLQAKTPEDMDELVLDLKDRVDLSLQGYNIYSIGFSDTSPELAKRVVQSMLTIFVESNLGSSRQDQDSAERFLQRETKDYERRLIDAERKLKDFQMRNVNFTSDKGSYYTRLQQAVQDLKAAEDQLNLGGKRVEELQAQVEDLETEGLDADYYEGVLDDPITRVETPEEQRIAGLEQQLEDLLLKYTERHPEVTALRDAISRLKAKRNAQRSKQRQKPGLSREANRALVANPLYQQLRLLLSEAEADLALQAARVENLKSTIEELQSSVNKVLQVEAEQMQLNRDYDILKENHTALLTRLEQARLTREVDSNIETVKFRTLDPPKVPTQPTGPNRIGIASVVFVVSVLTGIALAFLLSQLKPVFTDRRQLQDITGVQVLGSVNTVWSTEQVRRKRRNDVLFVAGFVGLLFSFAAVLAVFFFEVDVTSYLPV